MFDQIGGNDLEVLRNLCSKLGFSGTSPVQPFWDIYIYIMLYGGFHKWGIPNMDGLFNG